ncbi:hypothetical protein ACFY0G_46075, partial [Streptomyces sp. NPDC001552]|uniref:hypothetical protein n=1 Tax=Streptomyces sp. NPDC001552 TaxID=3364587 RepID=UPI0036C4A7C3
MPALPGDQVLAVVGVGADRADFRVLGVADLCVTDGVLGLAGEHGDDQAPRVQGDVAALEAGGVLGPRGVVEAGEEEGLVAVASEGVGAGAGDGGQTVDVGADGLAATFPGLQELDLQPGQGLAGFGPVAAADGE